MISNDVASQSSEETGIEEVLESERVNETLVQGILNQYDSDDDDRPFCRLCYGTKYDDTTLIEPCSCKGTVAHVHKQCLNKWLNRSGSKRCDLCLFEFKCEEKLRYGLFESIKIWTNNCRRRQFLMHDFCLFLTMNTITISMIALLFQAIYHIIIDEVMKESLPMWYLVALCMAAALWVIIYFFTCAVFFKTQIQPWYKWWRSMKKISVLHS